MTQWSIEQCYFASMNFSIETDILYGNACDVSITERGDNTEVSFQPDPHGGPESLWFCFRLTRTDDNKSPARIKLIWKNPINVLGGYAPQYFRPVVYYENGDWLRLDAPTVEELPDGRHNVSWDIDSPISFVDFAFCYPYGIPEIDALVKETNGYWRTDTIGVSQQGRPLVRLCNSYGEVGSTRPGLYLAARQHSGETSGSWVLDGFLRHLSTLGDEAPLTWVVPLSDIDGIEHGDYGKDAFPYDLNRAWGSPPMRHEIRVMQWDINRWSFRCQPTLALDFHSPAGCENDGLYFHIPNPERFPEFHQDAFGWTQAIKDALTATYASGKFERFGKSKVRWETPLLTSYFMQEYGIVGLTLEASYAMAGELVLTREHYREAGARMAAAVVQKINQV